MSVEIIVRSSSMAYATDFKRINESWILGHFSLEDSDIEILSNPQKYILDKGGNVFIALWNDKPVGTCALLVHDALTCELAKMAVEPEAQGNGIGFLLGFALIEKAKERGFTRIVLEGNTKMVASIALYRKLGFNKVLLNTTNNIHSRCNIYMELLLNPKSLLEYYI